MISFWTPTCSFVKKCTEPSHPHHEVRVVFRMPLRVPKDDGVQHFGLNVITAIVESGLDQTQHVIDGPIIMPPNITLLSS